MLIPYSPAVNQHPDMGKACFDQCIGKLFAQFAGFSLAVGDKYPVINFFVYIVGAIPCYCPVCTGKHGGLSLHYVGKYTDGYLHPYRGFPAKIIFCQYLSAGLFIVMGILVGRGIV